MKHDKIDRKLDKNIHTCKYISAGIIFIPALTAIKYYSSLFFKLNWFKVGLWGQNFGKLQTKKQQQQKVGIIYYLINDI